MAKRCIRMALCWAGLALMPSAYAVDLMEVFRLGLENDREYLSVEAATLAVREQQPQARASLLPNLNLNANTTGNRLDVIRPEVPGASSVRHFNSRGLTVSITQPIYNKELWIQLDQAGDSVKRSGVNFAFARQQLILRVAERYFDVLDARDNVEFLRARKKANAEQLNQAQQRFEVGLIAITDVQEAQAGFDAATADLIRAENEVDNANEALREVIGRYEPVLAPLGYEMPLVAPEPNNLDAWTTTALRQNLQIAVASYDADIAKKEIQRRQSGHLPTLEVEGGFDWNRRSETVGRSETQNASIGLQLNLPIYQGGLVLSQTREAGHLYQEALENLDAQRRSTQRETRDAFRGILSGISQVKARRQAVTSGETALRAIEAGFEVGTRTSIDVLTTTQRLAEEKRDLAAARYDYVLAILRLKQAAGTLSEEDLAEVNSWLE